MLKPTPSRGLLAATVLAATVLACGFAAPASAADAPPITAATLVDRAMIEDLLVDYYANLGGGKEDFAKWFTADGTLDVNGETGQGEKGIEAIYRATAARSAGRKGTFRMVLSNVKVVVNGNTATADCIWTGLNSETVTSPTVVVEQGREHDELVKQNGRWLFKHRVITSDGGMPPELLKTYKKR
jgi:ribosome-associated protein YbcJ (S4-like RNA binding protein)